MNYNHITQAYQNAERQALEEMNDPHLIVLTMFDALLKSMQIFETNIDLKNGGDAELKSKHFARALTIIYALQSSLDFEKGESIAANLFQLYEFARQQLLTVQLTSNLCSFFLPPRPLPIRAAVKLRALVKQALDDGIYFNACSFADKLVTMSAGLPEDVLLLARCHVAQGDHRQALDALRKYRLFDADTTRPAVPKCTIISCPLRVPSSFRNSYTQPHWAHMDARFLDLPPPWQHLDWLTWWRALTQYLIQPTTRLLDGLASTLARSSPSTSAASALALRNLRDSLHAVETLATSDFQGPMKRWNFGGQRASHGVSKTHRAHGSMGGCQDPGREGGE